MGYITNFRGAFHFSKQPSQELINKVNKFSEERHDDIFEYAPWCNWVITKDSKWRFKDIGVYDFEIDENTDDKKLEKYENENYQENEWVLKWNGAEKFYNYVEYLEYLIDEFFNPEGITLTGSIEYCGQMGLICEENIICDNGLKEVEDYRNKEATEIIKGLTQYHKDGLDGYIVDWVLHDGIEGYYELSGRLEENYWRYLFGKYEDCPEDEWTDTIKDNYETDYEEFLKKEFELSTIEWDEMSEDEKNRLRIGFVLEYIDFSYDMSDEDFWECYADDCDDDCCIDCSDECMKKHGYVKCYEDFFEDDWCNGDFARSILSDLKLYSMTYQMEHEKLVGLTDEWERLIEAVDNNELRNVDDNSELSEEKKEEIKTDARKEIQEIHCMFERNMWRIRDVYKGDSGLIMCEVKECEEKEDDGDCEECIKNGLDKWTEVAVVGVAGRFEH